MGSAMDIVIRAAVVFVFVWLVLRALGKRELGELTAFELVLLFVIGDLVQQSITQNDTSITAAFLAISTIALLIVAQSYAVFRWKRSRKVLEGEPVVVVHEGRFIGPIMRRERMTEDEVLGAAREQGIDDLSTVRVAILENEGKLSFITENGRQPPNTGSRIAE
jgi:uncharacterized membrane protein YcaP (DUF421 family)